MSGKIRAQTWKHVIILIFSIVIALAMALHFSKDAFAEEVVPAAAAEDGTAAEDAQSEEVLSSRRKRFLRSEQPGCQKDRQRWMPD